MRKHLLMETKNSCLWTLQNSTLNLWALRDVGRTPRYKTFIGCYQKSVLLVLHWLPFVQSWAQVLVQKLSQTVTNATTTVAVDTAKWFIQMFWYLHLQTAHEYKARNLGHHLYKSPIQKAQKRCSTPKISCHGYCSRSIESLDKPHDCPDVLIMNSVLYCKSSIYAAFCAAFETKLNTTLAYYAQAGAQIGKFDRTQVVRLRQHIIE